MQRIEVVRVDATKKDKRIRIVPEEVISAADSFNRKFSQAAGDTNQTMKKTRRGTLNMDELYDQDLSEVTSMNVTFFEDFGRNMIFSSIDSSWDDDGDEERSDEHWYGESSSGLGAMTLYKIVQRQDTDSVSIRFSGSVSFEDSIYSITTLPDGTVQVKAMLVQDFPAEIDFPEQMPSSSSSGSKNKLRGLSLRGNQPKPNTNQVSPNSASETSSSDSVKDRDLQSPNTTTDDGSVIDIICLYTRQALCQEALGVDYCDMDANRQVIDDKCAFAATETNIAYMMSGVFTRVRIVYSGYLDSSYTETTDFCSNLQNLAFSSNSSFVKIRELRNQYQADLVGLILDNSNSCGCSYMFSGDPKLGYFSVNRNCMTGYYSFSHEIGHNLGCNHEAAQYSAPAGAAYGYRDPYKRFRTIMSYSCQSNSNCPRVQRFSNPDTTYSYQGLPIGSYQANNVAQMNSAKYAVANYRLSVPKTMTPSYKPTLSPVQIVANPTKMPSKSLTRQPTSPSRLPTKTPTNAVTRQPILPKVPTKGPTKNPTKSPTKSPTRQPMNLRLPTKIPTLSPTKSRTKNPTIFRVSTRLPTNQPKLPTQVPTKTPSKVPSRQPFLPRNPTTLPSKTPTKFPSKKPTLPTRGPSRLPISSPTLEPYSDNLSRLNLTSNPSSLKPTLNPTSTTGVQSCGVNQVTLSIHLDRRTLLDWIVMDTNSNQVILKGGPYPSYSSTQPLTNQYCIASAKCLKIIMHDNGSVGFANSNSSYTVTVGGMLSNSAAESNNYVFTKTSGGTVKLWRTHYFSLDVITGFKLEGKWRTCSWVGGDSQRKASYCTWSLVRRMCTSTCKSCIQ